MKTNISASKILENKTLISEDLKDLEKLFTDLKEEMNMIYSSNTQYTKEFVKIFEEYESISKEILEFSKTLLDNVEKEIKVGIVGHFSHGKSTLINSFLQTPDEEVRDILPTGDGICTSVPTVIRFSSGSDIVYQMNAENLTPDEFHSKVTSIDDNSKVPDGIIINYGVQNIPKLEAFQKNNILLVDTPGMGGPYFNDNVLIKKWMEQFSLVLLIISAKDINLVSANRVKGFLRNYTKHILVFVTMWDEWESCDAYKECKNNESAQDKAMDLIAREFEEISQVFSKDELILKTVFVSAKNYLDPKMKNVPKDERFDESWGRNIGIEKIMNYISNKRDILDGGKMILSPLVQEKLKESKKVFEKLDFSKKTLREFYKKINKRSTKKESKIDTKEIKEYGKKTGDELNQIIEDAAKKISREIKNYANDMLRYENADYASFNGKVRDIYERRLSRLNKRLERTLEKRSVEVQRFIDSRLEEQGELEINLQEEFDTNLEVLENEIEDVMPEQFSVDYSSFTTAENIKGAFIKVFKRKEIEKNKRERFRIIKNRYINDVNSPSKIKENIDEILEFEFKLNDYFESLISRIEDEINFKNEEATDQLETYVENIEGKIDILMDLVKE